DEGRGHGDGARRRRELGKDARRDERLELRQQRDELVQGRALLLRGQHGQRFEQVVLRGPRGELGQGGERDAPELVVGIFAEDGFDSGQRAPLQTGEGRGERVLDERFV